MLPYCHLTQSRIISDQGWGVLSPAINAPSALVPIAAHAQHVKKGFRRPRSGEILLSMPDHDPFLRCRKRICKAKVAPGGKSGKSHTFMDDDTDQVSENILPSADSTGLLLPCKRLPPMVPHYKLKCGPPLSHRPSRTFWTATSSQLCLLRTFLFPPTLLLPFKSLPSMVSHYKLKWEVPPLSLQFPPSHLWTGLQLRRLLCSKSQIAWVKRALRKIIKQPAVMAQESKNCS